MITVNLICRKRPLREMPKAMGKCTYPLPLLIGKRSEGLSALYFNPNSALAKKILPEKIDIILI